MACTLRIISLGSNIVSCDSKSLAALAGSDGPNPRHCSNITRGRRRSKGQAIKTKNIKNKDNNNSKKQEFFDFYD
jgi:hypothetical protein